MAQIEIIEIEKGKDISVYLEIKGCEYPFSFEVIEWIKCELGLPLHIELSIKMLKNGNFHVRKVKQKVVRQQLTVEILEMKIRQLNMEKQNLLLQSNNIVEELTLRVVDVLTQQKLNLKEFCSGSVCIIDFWSTVCPNCPNSIAKLKQQKSACEERGIKMIFINTNDVQGARHVAMKEGFGTWLHVSMEEKERAKKIVGMKTLPFMLAVDKEFNVFTKGKTFSFESVFQVAPAPPRTHATCLQTEMMNFKWTCVKTGVESFFQDDIKSGRVVVLDFWSTTCQNCPAAVDRLQEEAKNRGDTVDFIMINTNSMELAKPMIEKRGWHLGRHYHVSLPTKEAIKTFLAMKTLPHHAMINEKGLLVGNGKNFDWNALHQIAVKAPEKENVASTNFVFSLNEDF